MRKLVATAIVLGVSALTASSASACGYYAVFQCAKTANLSGPGYVIFTNQISGFRPGYFCKVLGPFSSQGKAKAAGRAGQSYVKYGCAIGDD